MRSLWSHASTAAVIRALDEANVSNLKAILIVMIFPDPVPDLRSRLPHLRGRLIANQPLAELTWFRVGGPAT